MALTIAGSDSGGGAGVQADLATMAGHGVFGTSAVTSVRAQHTRGVESTRVLPAAEIDAQIEAVREDFDVRAAKTGMFATREVIELVADRTADAVVDSGAVGEEPMCRLLAANDETLLERSLALASTLWRRA